MRSEYLSLYKYLKRRNLSDETLHKLADCFFVKKYKKNEYFTKVGDVSDKVGFVVDGLFYMYSVEQDGTIFAKEFYQSNHLLLATFDPYKESTVYIQALKTSVILEAKYSEIQMLYTKNQEIELISKKRIENEVEAIYQRMTQSATMTAKERYQQFKEKYSDLEAEIPQYLIASYLGITPTQLSRIRTEIKSE